jgi:Tfp pilus assembly protein PilX
VISRLRTDERGWALVSSLALTAVVLGLGLALLSLVDGQSRASQRQREGDAAFNLAEAALNTEAFLLTRSWPTSGAPSTPCGAGALTAQGDLTGPATVPASAPWAQQVQARLVQSFAADPTFRQVPESATWQVNVCDDTTGRTVWSDDVLNGPAYDANGDGEVWVRAQATAPSAAEGSVRRRAVAALVAVDRRPILPAHFTVLAGGFEQDLGTALGSVASSQFATQAAAALIDDSGTGSRTYAGDPADVDASGTYVGGKLGVRCGVLDGCVTGALTLAGDGAQVAGVPLATFLGDNQVVQYASPRAASDDDVAALRREARATGSYLASVADGADCVPAGADGPAAAPRVVFVEQVGADGAGTCRIASGVHPKALVVGSGRVLLQGGASKGAEVVLDGVLLALNQQGDDLGDEPVVRIRDFGRVVGVFIDGKGKLDVVPPPFSTDAFVDALLGCSSLGSATKTIDFGGRKDVAGRTIQALGTAVKSVTVAASTLCAPARTAVKALGASQLVDLLVNGGTVNVTVDASFTGQLPLLSLLGINLGLTSTTATASVTVPVTIPALGPTAAATAFLQQLTATGYGPVVQQDAARIRAITAFGSSGTVQATFREVSPL